MQKLYLMCCDFYTVHLYGYTATKNVFQKDLSVRLNHRHKKRPGLKLAIFKTRIWRMRTRIRRIRRTWQTRRIRWTRQIRRIQWIWRIQQI